MHHIKEVKLESREVIASYDVKALFTSVPVDPSINTVKQKLQQDPLLSQRTFMSYTNSHTSGVCLKNTYFFHCKYYEQVHSTAMCFPISPLVAILFIKEFEVKGISSTLHPNLWLKFVDDTFFTQQAKHSQQLLQHFNSQDPHIWFTR